MKKRNIIYVIIVLVVVGLIAASVYIYQSNNTPKKASQAQQEILNTPNNKEITYKGKDGITALALLGQKVKVETSGTGEMSYVTTINGVVANSKKEYWAFSVNGKPAVVGAGSYITKSSDLITWKLSSF